jgi:hypothetical protein
MNNANKLRPWYVLPTPIDGARVQVRKNTAMSRVGIRPVDVKTGKCCGKEVIMGHGEYIKFTMTIRPLPEKEKTEYALTLCGYLSATGMILA